jgi:uncharacterized protein (DUF427 family)
MKPPRIAPGPGQESVWDYPSPPRVEFTERHVQVFFEGVVLADSRRARRVLLTARPPVYYIPPEDVRTDLLRRNARRETSEFKGPAHFYDLAVGTKRVTDAAWSFPDPPPAYAAIRDCIAFNPRAMEACFVDDDKVSASCRYGWITRGVVGPFPEDIEADAETGSR